MRRPLTPDQDAFGHALMDHLQGHGGVEIVERSDGHIDVSAGAEVYFAPPSGCQVDVVEQAVGRVLDIGCGAGRYALHLQERGHDVVGIDASPLAIEVCRRRGLLDARALTLEQVTRSLGEYDTVIMLGHNFGLFGSFNGSRRGLRRLGRILTRAGRIVVETLDPYATDDASHRAYHAFNRERGRMGGQIRMRVRYQRFRSPWFDYLFVSRPEMEGILEGTGWHIASVIDGEGPSWAAVLERDG